MAPLPLWFYIFAFGYSSAPYVLPITALAVLAYFCFGRPQFLRYALPFLAVFSAASITALAFFVGGPIVEKHRKKVWDAHHTHPLTSPLQMGSVRLPVGISVTDERHFTGNFYVHASTSHPVAIEPGVFAVSDFDIDPTGLSGDITLARDTDVEGIPCKARPVGFLEDRLTTCTLRHTYRIGGVIFPAGTLYDARGIELTVASEPPSLRVDGHRLPKGTVVSFATNDGQNYIYIFAPTRLIKNADHCHPFPDDIRYDQTTDETTFGGRVECESLPTITL